MNRFSGKIPLLILFALIWIVNDSLAFPKDYVKINDQPLVILSIDKVESIELLECELPAIRKFLEKSACGVMSIRTRSGYNNTESGFLTLGSGNRSVAPPIGGGAYKPGEFMTSAKAGSFWRWIIGVQPNEQYFIVPEIGWILNQARIEDVPVQPGLLGDLFRTNGWETSLIGDQDTVSGISRPGGYTLMDRDGILDRGLAGVEVNETDPSFPYRYRFNSQKAINGIKRHFKPRSLILVEFGDFARLDRFRDRMLSEQYLRLKQEIWERLNQFIGEFEKNWPTDQCQMILVSPSLSREGISKRSMLSPIVIRGTGYPKGLLTSGSTSWKGLVANTDLLPSLISMAALEPSGAISGRAIRSVPTRNHLDKVRKLNVKINKMNNSQRSLLDWYLWIISTGWLAVTLYILINKKLGNGFLLIIVAVIPLAMLILPLLPPALWQESGLFLLTTGLTLLLMKVKTTSQRYLILSAVLWGGLILDQISGWHLIRYSALGYSAVAGSRYYGIGNEYMGVFLAVSLVLAHLIYKRTNYKWTALIVLSLSIVILGWPQWGSDFGGTLAALVGFTFYTVELYRLDWKSRKVWMVFAGITLAIALIGWWDSLRDPDLQTHLGSFFQLLIDLNFSPTWQILSRKAAMNLKLLVFSAWTKISLLAMGIIILNRVTFKELKMVAADERIVWNAFFISGFVAFLVNDSGVVAFGTCLAYGFSYFLSRYEERVFERSNQETGVRVNQ